MTPTDFEAIILPHEGVLRRTARHMTRDLEVAEDVLQETLVKAWRALDRYDPTREARRWLLAILRRTVFDAARRRRREAGRVPLEEAPAPAGRGGLDALERADVLGAVARLPREYRDVVRLVAVEERSYRDAARALRIPVGTVMSRLHRGRKILRERLAEYDPGSRGPAPDGSRLPPSAAA